MYHSLGVCTLPLGCVPLPRDVHPYLGHSVFQDFLHFEEHSVLLIGGIHFLQRPETSEPLLQLGPGVVERGDPANATNVLTWMKYLDINIHVQWNHRG